MRSVLHSLFAVNALWEFSKTGKINQPLDVKFNHQLLSHIWRSHWSALLSSYTYSPTLKLYQGQFMCNIILSAFPSKVESHFRSVLIKKKKHLRGLSVRSVCTGTGVHTNLHHGLYRVCLHFYQSEGTRWVSPFRELTLKNCIQGNAHSCTQQIHCRFKFLYVKFLSCSAEDFETLATFSGFVECCDAVFAMKRVDYKTSSDLLRAFRVVDNGWISISDTAVS